MSGVVISGRAEPVPGLSVGNWHDDPALTLRLGEDCRLRRSGWIRQVIVHTTKGIWPQQILAGPGPNRGAERHVARFWSGSDKHAGAHLVVDFDGSVGCLADLQAVAAFHVGPSLHFAGAKSCNDTSIGIELYQGASGELYAEQLEAARVLIDWLTARFGVQRQVHAYRGRPVPRLQAGGADCVGVFGHRDCSDNRGRGDPGDEIVDVLVRAGYEAFSFDHGDDLEVWKRRQAGLGLAADGVPGPKTVAALKAAGRPAGLWV